MGPESIHIRGPRSRWNHVLLAWALGALVRLGDDEIVATGGGKAGGKAGKIH